MKRFFYLLFIGLFLVACGSSKKKASSGSKKEIKKEYPVSKSERVSSETKKYPTPKPDNRNTTTKVTNIIETAQSYKGTPYKYGGTTSKGMDCSGLVHTAFKTEGIHLPRASRDIAAEGEKINFQQINVGDLVFFKTNKSKIINHVGLVVDIFAGKIFFIHSSTSQGVIISSLDEAYWFNSYVEARRLL